MDTMESLQLDGKTDGIHLLCYSIPVSDMENVTINQRASYPTTKVTISPSLPAGGLFSCIISLTANTSFGLELQLEDSQR